MPGQCPACDTRYEERDARFCGACGHSLVSPGRYSSSAPPAPATASRSSDPLIGVVFGERYRAVRKIGEDGPIHLYAAIDVHDEAGSEVLVELVPPDPNGDVAARAKLLEELEAVRSLTHRSIWAIRAGGVLTDGTICIVADMPPGRSLARVLAKEAPLPYSRVVDLARQIAGALSDAHGSGVLLRSIDPDDVRIVDEGSGAEIAKVRAWRGPIRALTGTASPAYASPEQAARSAPVDVRSDVYSLGLLLYEMLTDEPPFVARDPSEWAEQHMRAHPRPFEAVDATLDIPDHAGAAVLRALSKPPEDRQASVGQLVRELAGEKPVDVPREARPSYRPSAARRRPMQPTMKIRPPSPRSRWAIAGVAVVAIATIAFWISESPSLGRAFAGSTGTATTAEELRAREASGEATRDALGYATRVHHARAVRAAEAALSTHDGRVATIAPSGLLTLDLGRTFRTDGTSAADVRVFVTGGSEYRVDVGEEPHRVLTIGEKHRGPVSLDLDEHGIREARFVRIRPANRVDPVRVDAVQVVPARLARR